MRIGELAEASGTTTRALRYYEEQGLLTSERTANGYRQYPRAAVLRVRNIRELLAIGFTISDVGAFLRYLDQDLPPVFGEVGPCETAMKVAHERLALLRDRIQSLTALHDAMASRLGAP